MDQIGPVEVWRGVVGAWDCDEMGHMNVRFYVARAMEGLAGLARRLGKAHAFSARATATFAVREHHIRFLREARAGARLSMDAGVVALGANDATVLQVLRHEPGGEPSATFTTHIEHVDPREQRAFPWPERSRQAAARLHLALPAIAEPRQLGGALPLEAATLERAEALGLPCQGRGAVSVRGCDVFGRLAAEQVIAKLSEGGLALMEQVRGAFGPVTDGRRIGAAALEYRIAYAALPRAGDHFEVRTGLIAAGPKVQHVGHWMLDPVTGRAWARAETVLAAFDLDARRIAPLPAEGLAKLQAAVVPGLGAPKTG